MSCQKLRSGEGFKRVAKGERGRKALMRSEICTLLFSIVFPTAWLGVEASSVGFKQVRQIFMCLAEKGKFAEWCFIESMFCCLQWKSNHSQLQLTIPCFIYLFPKVMHLYPEHLLSPIYYTISRLVNLYNIELCKFLKHNFPVSFFLVENYYMFKRLWKLIIPIFTHICGIRNCSEKKKGVSRCLLFVL